MSEIGDMTEKQWGILGRYLKFSPKDVSAEDRKRYEDMVVELTADLTNELEDREDLAADVDDLRKELRDTETTLDKARETVDDLTDQVHSLQERVEGAKR